MDDRQYKKLNRNLAITWFLLLAIIILVIFKVVFVNALTGPSGSTGPQGPKGGKGDAGSPGKDAAVVQIPTPVLLSPPTPIIIHGSDGKDGSDGAKGDPGQPGRELDVRYNQETGDIEKQYVGDDFWKPVVKGCELAKNCGDNN